MNTNTILVIENLSFKISGLAKAILHNITYTVNKGDFVILLGSNGSGKSSLLKLIDKRNIATHGQIYFVNKKINDYAHKKFSSDLITLTQNYGESLFNSLTVHENFLMAKQRVAKNSKNLLEMSDRNFCAHYLQKFNPNLNRKLETIASALSGGEQQALALALSVLHTPQLLLLDEYTSALDPKSAQRLIEITSKVISENNITCILATHDLKIALHYGNKILALRDGEIYCAIDKATEKVDEKKLLEIYC